MKTNSCLNCRHCKAVYRLYQIKYFREKWKYCDAKKEMTKNGGSCERWQKKTAAKYDVSDERLEKVQQDVACLAEILKDD